MGNLPPALFAEAKTWERGGLASQKCQIADKKPHPCRVHLVSSEHVLQHVELARLLSTSSKGMSATTATLLLD
ncbi:MAG TPA: hypothetical protein VF480_07730, partial [Verrucomicrobiae bacterium]